MLYPLIVVWMLAVSTMLFGAGAASGQDYPTKSIRIIAGEPGNSNDLASRLIAQGLTEAWNQQVIVENRATAVIAPLVSQAQSDGYTLLYSSGSMWIGPLIEKLPYDPVRDFAPVTWAVSSPLVLAVHPSVPANSVKELIDLARAKPGQLNYASSATGGNPHLAMELLKSLARVDIVRVPYKGGTPAINAVAAGEVQMVIVTPNAMVPLFKAGKLRALGVASAKRSTLFPDIPTIAESGLPGYESGQYSGVLVPAKTPVAVVSKLNREIVRVLIKPETKAKLAPGGAEVVASSPKQFADIIAKDMAVNGKLIKDAGIRAR